METNTSRFSNVLNGSITHCEQALCINSVHQWQAAISSNRKVSDYTQILFLF